MAARVGNDYSPDEISEWARKIDNCKAREAWIYFDNDRDAFAIKNARMLIEQLNARGLTNLKLPSLSV